MVHVRELAAGLAAMGEKDFTRQRVLDFLQVNPVDPSSLAPYLYFSREHYTRNLIHRTDLFELIAICWEIGQKSPVHNHRDQNCWMAIAYGKVIVHNFRLIRKDPSTGFCELQSSTQFVIERNHPGEVDPAEPIHQVINPASYGSRAVTLHIYSKPFDTCEVYDLKDKRYRDVRLVNTSEYGILKSDLSVEKAVLG